ncbi:MAG: mevalonate kinase [Patescibacteria group bacterium]
MTLITASAPGKLLLYGDHAVVYGKPCIVTAVDQRVHVTVKKNGVDTFHLDAPDLGLTAYSKTINDLGQKELPKSVAFIEICYKRFLEKYPQQEGIVVTTKSDFSSLFGFGSSSAVTVAFAKALTTLYGITLTNKELFNLCYQAVIDVQGVGSGFDIAAAIWGGTIYYVTPAKVVKVVSCPELPLIVGYTGVKADTPTLIRMVESLKQQDSSKIKTIFNHMSNIVDAAFQTISESNWEKAGKLMNQNQLLLRELQVSSVKLESLIEAAITAGAYGAKLSGAGGGDCMIALCDKKYVTPIATAIEKAGGKYMDVNLNAQGVRIEK